MISFVIVVVPLLVRVGASEMIDKTNGVSKVNWIPFWAWRFEPART